MNRLIAASLFAATALTASAALPCGGGFGTGLEVSPSQKIVVVHDQGTETYVFSPHFCGRAAQFGLVLPIPSALASNPSLAESSLFTQLDDLTAPEIVYTDVCAGNMDAGAGGGAGSYDAGSNGGVDVVNRGQVGIFDWVLLQADSTAAFTDWLDANAFPYDANATGHFSHYVDQSWFFVAFKVTADDQAPPDGYQLCGDLGPISVSFPTTDPVIPARIAAVDTSSPYGFSWQVFAFTDVPVDTATPGVTDKLLFTGALTADQLGAYPEVAKIALEGDQLTKLQLTFYGSDIQQDITLTPSNGKTSYRETIHRTRTIDCPPGVTDPSQIGSGGGDEDDGGCTLAASGSKNATFAFGLALCGAAFLLLRRR